MKAFVRHNYFKDHLKIGNVTIISVFLAVINCIFGNVFLKKTCFSILSTGFVVLRVKNMLQIWALSIQIRIRIFHFYILFYFTASHVYFYLCSFCPGVVSWGWKCERNRHQRRRHRQRRLAEGKTFLPSSCRPFVATSSVQAHTHTHTHLHTLTSGPLKGCNGNKRQHQTEECTDLFHTLYVASKTLRVIICIIYEVVIMATAFSSIITVLSSPLSPWFDVFVHVFFLHSVR